MQTFFQEKNKNGDVFFNLIEKACEGLIYISETDAPVIPFKGQQTQDVSARIILKQTGQEPGTPVEERDFDKFFDRLTSDRDWYGDPEKERAEKFQALKTLLEENLRQRKVFRTGSTRIAIYAVGLDVDGRLTGVMTNAVET